MLHEHIIFPQKQNMNNINTISCFGYVYTQQNKYNHEFLCIFFLLQINPSTSIAIGYLQ